MTLTQDELEALRVLDQSCQNCLSDDTIEELEAVGFRFCEDKPLRDAIVDDHTLAGDESVLVCPICGCDNVHADVPMRLNGYESRIDNDRYEYSSEEVRRETNRARGHTVVIPFWCENACFFEVRFSQHKGTTYVSTHDVIVKTKQQS